MFRRLADFGQLRHRRHLLARPTRASRAGSSPTSPSERGEDAVRRAGRHRASTTSCAPSCGPCPPDDDDAVWALRARGLGRPRGRMLGGSDAGAHLDRMCGAPYTTRFLGDCIRGRKLVSLERGGAAASPTSRRGSSACATAAGCAEGCHADVVVFDPDTDRRRPRHPRARPARRQPPASPPRRTASCGCSSTASRPSPTAPPPAPPPAPSSAAAATPPAPRSPSPPPDIKCSRWKWSLCDHFWGSLLGLAPPSFANVLWEAPAFRVTPPGVSSGCARRPGSKRLMPRRRP